MDHVREHRSVLASAEKRLLIAIAGRLPGWLSSDHLTLVGLLAMAGAGFAFAAIPITARAAPLFALATRDLPALRAYFERLRDVRLAIGGRELAELGLGESPRVGEILGELRRRKLNGELDGRESELAAARQLIAQP